MDNNLLGDRIGRLKDWEQTGSLNEILYNTLSSLNAYTKERFDKLTQEIMDESALGSHAPAIRVAVCSEENLDKQIFMHPVAEEPPHSSPNYVTTIFVECDYPTIQQMMKQTYVAIIHGEAGTRKTQVELKYSMKYLQKLESLYYTFNENRLPWATVNGRYFYKFIDVCCTNEATHKINEFEIDFGQYKKYVSYDKILLWNVAPMTAPVAECEAKPAYNSIQYEHLLKKIPLDSDQYLVCPMGDRFKCFRRGNDIYVRTYTKQLKIIQLLRVISNEDAECPLYLPAKSNHKKPDLLNSKAEGACIPTRGEAERIVYSLGDAADLRLVGVKTLPLTQKNIERYKGIDYNYFREDNKILNNRKLLLFSFKINEDKIWSFETMYYALSVLQLYFYEYHCVGEIS